MTHQHHSIDYLEFTISEMIASKKFYSEAFGWEFTDYAPNYAGIKGKEREIGGFSVGEVKPGGSVLVVLYSDNLEKTLSSVRQAGGTITEEPFEFPGGRRFHFLDPSGNELAVWGELK